MGNELTEGERLMRLETRLETELVAIKEALYDLKKIVMLREETYVTKDVLAAELKLRDKEIERLQEDKKTNKQLLPSWTNNIIAFLAILVSLYAIFNK